MKTLTALCFLFIEFLFLSSLHATTIMVIARNGQIYIGADGRAFFSSSGGNSSTGVPFCKVKQYGAVVVARYGVGNFRVKDNGTGKFLTFDLDKITRIAVSAPGSLSHKADLLQQKMWVICKRP